MLFPDSAARRLAIGLAALAGFVDALGFLSLGGWFVSFMTGNSTRFAVGLSTGASWHLALLPIGIVALFVLGVMLGRALRHYRQRLPSTVILTFMAVLLMAAAALHEIDLTTASIALMAVAMGAANNVFTREGEVSIGVTYMTGTLVKFGQRLAGRLLGETDRAWLPYLLLWAALVIGAVLGAFAYSAVGLRSLWIAVAACAVLAAMCWRSENG